MSVVSIYCRSACLVNFYSSIVKETESLIYRIGLSKQILLVWWLQGHCRSQQCGSMNLQHVVLFSVAFEPRLQLSARIWTIRLAYRMKPASKYLAWCYWHQRMDADVRKLTDKGNDVHSIRCKSVDEECMRSSCLSLSQTQKFGMSHCTRSVACIDVV